MKKVKSTFLLLTIVFVAILSGCCRRSDNCVCPTPNYVKIPSTDPKTAGDDISRYLGSHSRDSVYLSLDDFITIIGDNKAQGIYFQRGIDVNCALEIFAIAPNASGTGPSVVSYKIAPRPCPCPPCCSLKDSLNKTPQQ
jgi:hypothetical protein